MTERDAKKLKSRETPRPRGLVSQEHVRGSSDPFDDDGLDEILEKALSGVAEPKLVITDRTIRGMRIVREV